MSLQSTDEHTCLPLRQSQRSQHFTCKTWRRIYHQTLQPSMSFDPNSIHLQWMQTSRKRDPTAMTHVYCMVDSLSTSGRWPSQYFTVDRAPRPPRPHAPAPCALRPRLSPWSGLFVLYRFTNFIMIGRQPMIPFHTGNFN